ncbi:hypothetical protein AVEN_270525-1 [Araneus ventricosus]|uniref:Uncharacterized protein n=1 Tax=Araneus ventricosus TaxID=182803 RepID=A0A4Y2B7E2_ARAVE|nr:hypothetical protein AVEN_270525-1 [Araneus ventricosus]
MADSEKCPKLSPLVIILSCLLLPSGLAYPAEEIPVGDTEPLAYHMSGADKFHPVDVSHLAENEKPRSCFHFFVSRNMSSLLSDATKMLQQVRDRREREWILTFIYRIKALAEHLRTHPESRNYDCLPGEDVNRIKDSILNGPVKNPQQELYFVDESWPSSLQKRTDTSDTNHQPDETESQTADNQSSHPLSTGAWHEESMYNISPEQKAENVPSASEVPSSSAGSVSSKPEAEGKLVDSIPTSESASATHPELNLQEKDDGHREPEDKTSSQSNDDSSSIGKQPYGNGIVLSSPPDCSSSLECEKALSRHATASSSTEKRPSSAQEDDALVQQLHSNDKNFEDDMNHQKLLKERIRKALLEEMAPEVKKLRTVGGSEEDLINLWKQSESESGKSTETYHDSEFDYEEIGAAAGDLSSSDSYTTNDHTVAPSLSEVKNFKRQSNSGTKAYEPYDDSDVLVKQLFDVRFEQAPSKTTKSLSDQREEYLISSTQVPY